MANAELEALLEKEAIPTLLSPLAPSPVNHREDSDTLSISEVITENWDALKELLPG